MCVCVCVCVCVCTYTCTPMCVLKSLQSCLTLCNPMDCSQPGSSVLGISQARILEWVAVPFSIPSPGDLPDPGIELRSLMSPALASRFFPTAATWEAHTCTHVSVFISPLLKLYFNKLRVHTATFSSSSVPKDSTQPSPYLICNFLF